MATVGEDFAEYRAWLEASGVDTSLMEVVPDEFTSSFFATTDQDSAQLASFCPGANRKASAQSLVALPKMPDLVAIFPTDPLAMMKFAAEYRSSGYPTSTTQANRSRGSPGRSAHGISTARTSSSATTTSTTSSR